MGDHGSGSGGGGCFRSEVLRGPLGEATLPDVLAWKKRHAAVTRANEICLIR